MQGAGKQRALRRFPTLSNSLHCTLCVLSAPPHAPLPYTPNPLPQPVQPGRSRDRFVSLPDEFQGDQQPGQVPEATPTIFEVRQWHCCWLNAAWLRLLLGGAWARLWWLPHFRSRLWLAAAAASR